MSAGVVIPAEQAHAAAEDLIEILRSSCQRIEIAGSLRRGKSEVHDLEIVAEPRYAEQNGGDLWGTTVETDLLEVGVQLARQTGVLRLRDVEIHRKDGSVEIGKRDGASYKALEFRGLPVDLFIVRPPADWGVIFTIRTGPADWSHRLVTDCQRFLRRVEGGRLYRSGQYVPCPTERDFFTAIGQPWVEPEQRDAALVSIQAVSA